MELGSSLLGHESWAFVSQFKSVIVNCDLGTCAVGFLKKAELKTLPSGMKCLCNFCFYLCQYVIWTKAGREFDLYLVPPEQTQNLSNIWQSLFFFLIIKCIFLKLILHACKIKLAKMNVYCFSVSTGFCRSDYIAARGKMFQSQLYHFNCNFQYRKFNILVTCQL